jgi:hypothetical protein
VEVLEVTGTTFQSLQVMVVPNRQVLAAMLKMAAGRWRQVYKAKAPVIAAL